MTHIWQSSMELCRCNLVEGRNPKCPRHGVADPVFGDDIKQVEYALVECGKCGERFMLPEMADGWLLNFEISGGCDVHSATATITELDAGRVE